MQFAQKSRSSLPLDRADGRLCAPWHQLSALSSGLVLWNQVAALDNSPGHRLSGDGPGTAPHVTSK